MPMARIRVGYSPFICLFQVEEPWVTASFGICGLAASPG